MEQIGIINEGNVYDLQTAKILNIQGVDIFETSTPQALDILRHSCAHMMAQAIKILHPELLPNHNLYFFDQLK